MAGLGSPAQAPQQFDAGGAASPEEQALYNRFVAMAVMALSDEKLLPKTVDMLKANKDPVAGVAEVAASMARRVYDLAKQEGTEIPGDVLMNGGKEVVEYTVEIAEAAQVAEFSPEMIEQAYLRAADLFMEGMQSSGNLNQEAMAQDAPALQQMKESGALDQMVARVSQEQEAS